MDVDVMPRHGFEVVGGPWAGAIHCSLTFEISGGPRVVLDQRATAHGPSALDRGVRPRQSHSLATFARSTTTSVRMPSRDFMLNNPLRRNGTVLPLGTSKPLSSKSKVSTSCPPPSRMVTRNQIREASREVVLRVAPRTNIFAPSGVLATRVDISDTTRVGTSTGLFIDIVRLIAKSVPKNINGMTTTTATTTQAIVERGSRLFPNHDWGLWQC